MTLVQFHDAATVIGVFFAWCSGHRGLHSFPTRRSSDLASHHRNHHKYSDQPGDVHSPVQRGFWWSHAGWMLGSRQDRKSTRLNSSHVRISYAVFCLKKKIMACLQHTPATANLRIARGSA